jgi:hypothetical protein
MTKKYPIIDYTNIEKFISLATLQMSIFQKIRENEASVLTGEYLIPLLKKTTSLINNIVKLCVY